MADLEFDDRMSDSDALMWGIEKDPLLRSTIVAVAILDQAPDRERLIERIHRSTLLIPRLRQHAVQSSLSAAPPRWVFDPNFDLNYHLRFLKAPGNGTMRELLDLVAPIGMQGFDRARPLWEFYIVEGLEGGKAAMVQKVHHSVTDGVGGVEIALTMLDLEREPTVDLGPLPEAPAPQRFNALELLTDGIAHEARRQAGIVSRLAGEVVKAVRTPRDTAAAANDMVSSLARMLAPAFEPLSPLMVERSLSAHYDTLTISLPDLKSAAKAAGGKLNDAFVGAVAGGLRAYHAHHGVDIEALRMGMPINIREASAAAGGNQFVPARFAVPTNISDPVERMAAIRELVLAQRAEPALGFVSPMAGVLTRLPSRVTTQLFGSMLKGVDFTTSNVPGAPMDVYLAGAHLEASFPFGPLSGAALNITLMSGPEEVYI
ncbi:MAG TPA: wax ester/triacylglycerol synthase domain-containing protein, partial [Acidimicrobiales bacterium]|nr:wax ester/triacylglycerol synthase domain-containing protein [Acidimicrobiales bacterium]